MKKYLVAIVALCLVGGLAFAAPLKGKGKSDGSSLKLTPLVDKGELLVNAGIGWGGIFGGAEMGLARFDIADIIPITIGAGARAFVDPGLFYSTFGFGIGACATAHIGFKGIDLPSEMSWLTDFDSYIGLGLGFGGWLSPKPGFCSFDGISYYLKDNFALNLEYGYMGNGSYYGFGCLIKL